ncbi:MAG: hypothetical protein V1794_12030 [Candidatus Glassbacteria bacterium]
MQSIITRARFRTVCALSWAQLWLKSNHYRCLAESELRGLKKSDTVFIFGSGYSINSISPSEWEHFARFDTLSFNWFVWQSFVRIDFHLVREISPSDLDSSIWPGKIAEYGRLITGRPFYASTVFLMQGDFTAVNANRLLLADLLPRETRIFRYRTRSKGKYEPPSKSFEQGLVHGPSTLMECVNFCYIMGWKKIVLVGVDLYDRRYFWLDEDEIREGDRLRGADVSMKHNTAERVVEFMAAWRKEMARDGVELMVYNPGSLLKDVLEIYQTV